MRYYIFFGFSREGLKSFSKSSHLCLSAKYTCILVQEFAPPTTTYVDTNKNYKETYFIFHIFARSFQVSIHLEQSISNFIVVHNNYSKRLSMRRRSQTRDRYKDSESISDDSDYIDDSNQQRRKSLTNRRHYPHVIVTHNYHDHANEPVAESFPPENHGKTRSRRTIGVNVSFPIKLYEMLEVTEKDGLADIISWQPHGRCVSS